MKDAIGVFLGIALAALVAPWLLMAVGKYAMWVWGQ